MRGKKSNFLVIFVYLPFPIMFFIIPFASYFLYQRQEYSAEFKYIHSSLANTHQQSPGDTTER